MTLTQTILNANLDSLAVVVTCASVALAATANLFSRAVWFEKIFGFSAKKNWFIMQLIPSCVLGLSIGMFSTITLNHFFIIPNQGIFYPGRTMLVQQTGNMTRVVRILTHGEYLPKDELANSQPVRYASIPENIEMKATPITDNPKVMQLRYYVHWDSGGTPSKKLTEMEFLTRIREQGLISIPDYLKMLCYDFQYENSRTLAMFSNPFRLEQQADFERLLKNHLGPKVIGTPIKLEDLRAGFQLN